MKELAMELAIVNRTEKRGGSSGPSRVQFPSLATQMKTPPDISLLGKGDTSNVVRMGTFLMSVDKTPIFP
jgi:hypothetical protein